MLLTDGSVIMLYYDETYRIGTEFPNVLVYCNVIRMELRSSVVPAHYVLTGCKEEGGGWHRREGFWDFKGLQLTFLNIAAMFSR